MPEFVNESGGAGLIAAGVVFTATCVVGTITYLVFRLLIRYSQRDGLDTHHTRILVASQGQVIPFAIILGIFLAYFVLIQHPHPIFDFANEHDVWSFRIWLVTVIAQASYVGTRIIQELLQWYEEKVSNRTESNLDDRLLPQARRITPVVIYAVGALMALDVIGITIAPMLAGLGIAGIAVGLALQPTLSNLFSGMFMVSEGELNEGDFIELDGGPSGFVVDVSWRSTKIRDRFNNLIMIPNSKIMDSVMTNYVSESTAVTILVPCGVSYESNLEKVERVSLEVANGVRDDLKEAVDDFDPVVRFSDFGESNIDFNVIMQASDRLGSFVVKHELIKRLHSRLRQEGIEINYPVRKLVGLPSNELDDALSGDGLEVRKPVEDGGE